MEDLSSGQSSSAPSVPLLESSSKRRRKRLSLSLLSPASRDLPAGSVAVGSSEAKGSRPPSSLFSTKITRSLLSIEPISIHTAIDDEDLVGTLTPTQPHHIQNKPVSLMSYQYSGSQIHLSSVKSTPSRAHHTHRSPSLSTSNASNFSAENHPSPQTASSTPTTSVRSASSIYHLQDPLPDHLPVLPNSNARPFSKWDVNSASGESDDGADGEGAKRQKETWDLVDALGRRHLRVGTAKNSNLPYPIGYEKAVLDMEALLHAQLPLTIMKNGKSIGTHTILPCSSLSTSSPPLRVLDLGTGLGLWPISMALEWRDTIFIGMDVADIQVDLSLLNDISDKTELEQLDTRSVKSLSGVKDRIQWIRGSFLDPLPFDSGSFDLVHIRNCYLAVPELQLDMFLEECCRVLKQGTGLIEIVETSFTLPNKNHFIHPVVRQEYDAILMERQLQHIQSSATLRAALVAETGFAKTREVVKESWSMIEAPGVLKDIGLVWATSIAPPSPQLQSLMSTHEKLISKRYVDALMAENWEEGLNRDGVDEKTARSMSLRPPILDSDLLLGGDISITGWVGIKAGLKTSQRSLNRR